MARPKKSEARDTPRAILDAALELFSEQGFAGTSMREIARAVGVRESALYHHFPSKDAIFKALISELGPGKANLIRHLDFDAVLSVGGLTFLKQLVQLMSAEWADPREQKFARLMLSDGPRLAQHSALQPAQFIAGALEAFEVLFQELVARKLVRPEPPAQLALGLIAPLMLLRIRWLVMTAEPGPEAVPRARGEAGRVLLALGGRMSTAFASYRTIVQDGVR